ncbi:endonuclease/exonuclease/phosphatase family protein [Xanthobacter sp. KR7-65]|uniref:endonuclease/exonuclease/phosphatase family protein n=1 Tax=Xanthobacter sp. KR7-65 TaxID=3156612 RepID=UPI0032B33884
MDMDRKTDDAPDDARPIGPARLRVLTYNVRRCLGVDGRYAPERIAALVARTGADVVALQELDVNRLRSGGVDQALAIAGALRMAHHFHPAMRVVEELYGDAILTHLPMRLVKAGTLPGRHTKWQEPRGALWVEITVAGRPVQVINTHLGLMPGERIAQAAALLGREWLGNPACEGPAILLGDFNARPSSAAYRLLARSLQDVQLADGRRPRPTFPGRWPTLRIDHVFVRGGVDVADVRIVTEKEAPVASDHLPLCADLLIAPTVGTAVTDSGAARSGTVPAREVTV